MKKGRKVKMPSRIFCVLLNSIVDSGRGYLQINSLMIKNGQKKTARVEQFNYNIGWINIRYCFCG